MRHREIAVLVVALTCARATGAAPLPETEMPQEDANGPARLGLTLRLGFQAVRTAATTRAWAWDFQVGSRWYARERMGLSLSYRGSLRDSGTDVVGVLSTLHRLQIGAFALGDWGRWRLGGELGAHGRLRTSYLHADRGTDHLTVDTGLGIGADTQAGFKLGERSFAVLSAAAYQRGTVVDIAIGLGVDWDFD